MVTKTRTVCLIDKKNLTIDKYLIHTFDYLETDQRAQFLYEIISPKECHGKTILFIQKAARELKMEHNIDYYIDAHTKEGKEFMSLQRL